MDVNIKLLLSIFSLLLSSVSSLQAKTITFDATQSWETEYVGYNTWVEHKTNIEFFSFDIANDGFIDFTIKPKPASTASHFDPSFRLFSGRLSETTGIYKSPQSSFSSTLFLGSGSYIIGITSGLSTFDDYIIDGFVNLWNNEVSSPKQDVDYRLKIHGDVVQVDEPLSATLLILGLACLLVRKVPAKKI